MRGPAGLGEGPLPQPLPPRGGRRGGGPQAGRPPRARFGGDGREGLSPRAAGQARQAVPLGLWGLARRRGSVPARGCEEPRGAG